MATKATKPTKKAAEVKAAKPAKAAKNEVIPTTKAGIMAALAESAGITKVQATAVYTKLIELAVKGAKQEEKGYMLPGIGKVKKVVRAARMGRNPATNEPMKIAKKVTARIAACKAFKDAITGK